MNIRFNLRYAVTIFLLWNLLCFTNVSPLASTPDNSIGNTVNYVNELTKLAEDDQVDILSIKLTIDKLIDPKTDTQGVRKQIDQMVKEISVLRLPEMSDWDSVQLLRQYIYDAGEWNNSNVFSYDTDDPQGTSTTSRRLDYYLKNRKGNCVSMPVLHAILGQKTGLDMTLSTAPLHMFVRYTDKKEEIINIEATSGGHPARAAWYQKELPMLPKAIQNGMYMKSLSRKETIAVLGQDLASHLLRSGQYEDSVLVSEKLIELFPNYGPLYMTRGSALYKIVERDFQSKYPDIKDVPEDKYSKLQFLLKQNMISFQTAEELGWRDPDQLKKELQAKQ